MRKEASPMVSRRVIMAAAVHSHHSRRSMRRNAARGSADRAKLVCSRLFGGSRFKCHPNETHSCAMFPKGLGSRVSSIPRGPNLANCSCTNPSKYAPLLLAWTAGNLLYVQEDTVFRKVRGVGKVRWACAIMGGKSRFGTGPEKASLLGLATRPEETMEAARDRVSFRSGKPMRCRGS